jgi:hypothetical protein
MLGRLAFEKLTSSRGKVPRRGSCAGTRTTVAGQACSTNVEAIAISSPIANAQKAFLTASPAHSISNAFNRCGLRP